MTVRDNSIDDVCIHVFTIHVQKPASHPKSPGRGTAVSPRSRRCTVIFDGNWENVQISNEYMSA